MKTLNLFIMSLMIVLASVFADAQRRNPISENQRVNIQLDQHFRKNSVIRLKQEIKQMYPRMNLQNMNILSVRMVAKSQQGQGSAELLIGGRTQDRARIYGNPRDFQDPSPRTYDRVNLENFGGDSQGAWQIELQGNIKVKNLVIMLQQETRRGGPGGGDGRQGRITTMALGGDTADKVIQSSKTYYIRENVKALELRGTKSKLQVHSVIIEYGNGQTEHLPELEGGLKDGQMKRANIGGRRVVSMTVVAETNIFVTSRGKYEALAQVLR